MPQSYPQISTQVLWMAVKGTCGMRKGKYSRPAWGAAQVMENMPFPFSFSLKK
jgi:hypothetical protein